MKSKFLSQSKGFSLIEIIVVLIMVGILAAIALPSYFSWISKGQAAEAISNMGPYKSNLEACLNTHIDSEGNSCNNLTYMGTANFNYALSSPIVNTADPDTGISGCIASLMATPVSGGGPSDYILFSRDATGNWTCSGSGEFNGIC